MRRLFLTLCVLLVAGKSATQETLRTVHVFVALCDNKTQGIIPVRKELGDGNDPRNNLYWGALYGVKTFFEGDEDWNLVSTENGPAEDILERCVFRHKTGKVFLVTDAYRGSKMKRAVEDFLAASAGNSPKTLEVGDRDIRINGGADLVVYIGHNALMDFDLERTKREKGSIPKDAIVLACKSKVYFHDRLSRLGCRSVLLTMGLMAPEAYTLDAALEGWIAGESSEKIRSLAGRAYHKYQKCGIDAATRLFYSEDKKKEVPDKSLETDD